MDIFIIDFYGMSGHLYNEFDKTSTVSVVDPGLGKWGGAPERDNKCIPANRTGILVGTIISNSNTARHILDNNWSNRERDK